VRIPTRPRALNPVYSTRKVHKKIAYMILDLADYSATVSD
jgi:hypothetical protein